VRIGEQRVPWERRGHHDDLGSMRRDLGTISARLSADLGANLGVTSVEFRRPRAVDRRVVAKRVRALLGGQMDGEARP